MSNNQNKNILQDKKKKFIIVGISIITLFCLVCICIAWPFWNQNHIDEQFVEVLDACINNEESRQCTKTLREYNMTFEYCHSLTDIPKISEEAPIYAVARLNDFIPSKLNYLKQTTKSETQSKTNNKPKPPGGVQNADERQDGIYPYYACATSLDGAKTIQGDDLLRDPQTLALLKLSEMPNHTFSGDTKSCSIQETNPNQLWEQIPNISLLKDEWQDAANTYKSCGQQDILRATLDKTNHKADGYARKYINQVFYQKYDEWTATDQSLCRVGDRVYQQTCGAVTSQDDEFAVDTVQKFAKAMREFIDSDNFAAKKIKD